MFAGTPIIAQEKPQTAGEATEKSLDPRLQALIGKWEGSIQFLGRVENPDRILIIHSIMEHNGQLEVKAEYGTPEETLKPVHPSVELLPGGTVLVRFTTAGGGNVTLSLIKENWLSGSYRVVPRTARDPERPMQLQRKSN